MNKKSYIKPATRVITLQHRQQLLINSQVETVNTNLTGDDKIILGNSGSGSTARGRQYDCWGEEEVGE